MNYYPDWILEDLANSGLIPQDFDLPVIGQDNGYLIPYPDPATGKVMLDLQGRPFQRLKLEKPIVDENGKKIKYRTEQGAGNRIFIPLKSHEYFTNNVNVPSFLTEGEKKALASTIKGFPCLGLAGIWNWLESKEQRNEKYQIHADLIPYLANGRDVYFVFDSDATDPRKKLDFQDCAFRFAVELAKYGCKLYVIILPQDGSNKVGLDDFLLKHTTEELQEYIQSNKFLVDHEDIPPRVKTKLNAIASGIKNIPEDTSPLKLPTLLEPVLREIAKIEESYSEPFLSDIEKRFKLKNNITTYRQKLKKLRKEILSNKRKVPNQINLDSVKQQLSNQTNKKILLIKTNVLKSELCNQIFTELKKKNIFFRYGGGISKIIKGEKLDAKTEKLIETAILSEVSPAGFITDIEEWFTPVTVNEKEGFKPSSFNEADSRIFLNSKNAYTLPEICGFSLFRLPYITGKRLLFTEVGYNSDRQIFTESFAPQINFISVIEAKLVLRDLLKEFCFLEPELDLSRAVAYIISPALTLLTYNRRAMCFLADGNREGVGKDYLLGIPYLIYENSLPIFSSLCNTDDEYRKFLFAACAEGQKIILFSNLKGFLNSQAFEHYCTSQVIKDRVLGVSKNREYPNTALYGVSGNGVTFTPDMERRLMHIRLEYYEEQIKNRQFKCNLYDYIRANRQTILNAIYTLIKNWFDNGAILGKKIPSFEEWASIVSGILMCNGFQNPFDERKIISQSLSVGGNTEDNDVRHLVIAWWNKHGQYEVLSQDLRDIASESSLFRHLNLDEKSGQCTFGKLITKRENRIYANKRIRVFPRGKYTKFALEETRDIGDIEDISNPTIFAEEVFNTENTNNNSELYNKLKDIPNIPNIPLHVNLKSKKLESLESVVSLSETVAKCKDCGALGKALPCKTCGSNKIEWIQQVSP